jgi:hypothetical protein
MHKLTEKHACTKGDETDACFLCRAMPLAFNPTNSPLAERLLATRRRCLGRIDLPVSDVADDKFYIKNHMQVH